MPHAQNGTLNTNKMSTTTVNGEKPHSQTLDHIVAYPLTSDIIQIYQRNALGAKSINLFHSFYHTFAEPILPYFKTPYSIVAPYLEQADNLGDSALSNVDERFPALRKTDIDTLKSHAVDAAHYPIKVAIDGRDYVFATYDEEYKKSGGQGLIPIGRAVLFTEVRIAGEVYRKVAAWLGPKKAEASDEFEKMKKLGNEKMQKTKKTAQDKIDQAQEQGHEKEGTLLNYH